MPADQTSSTSTHVSVLVSNEELKQQHIVKNKELIADDYCTSFHKVVAQAISSPRRPSHAIVVAVVVAVIVTVVPATVVALHETVLPQLYCVAWPAQYSMAEEPSDTSTLTPSIVVAVGGFKARS